MRAPCQWFQTTLDANNNLFDKNSLFSALRLAKEFKPCRVALDVGAHCGSWTLPIAAEFAEVHAFEPFKPNYDCLVTNTKKTGNVTTYNVGLSNRSGVMKMKSGHENSGQAHVADDGDSFAIMERLDSYGFKDVDFIKIDAEGYELKILTGAKSLLEKYKPVVCLELNGLAERYGIHDEDVRGFMAFIGYKLYCVENKDYIYA